MRWSSRDGDIHIITQLHLTSSSQDTGTSDRGTTLGKSKSSSSQESAILTVDVPLIPLRPACLNPCRSRVPRDVYQSAAQSTALRKYSRVEHPGCIAWCRGIHPRRYVEDLRVDTNTAPQLGSRVETQALDCPVVSAKPRIPRRFRLDQFSLTSA